MAQIITNSGHEDMIHHAALDYYGRRLATCSSDRTIKIFEIEGETHRHLETLKGHDGAVFCISWAHPKYGSMLASCSYDGKTFVWREQNGKWQKLQEFTTHTASVNMVSWAPHEAGCILADASTDGNVTIAEYKDNKWSNVTFPAHASGVNAVDWAPFFAPGSVVAAGSSLTQPTNLRRFVTGGTDCLAKIWEWNQETQNYVNSVVLRGHSDWIRDVCWAPTILSKTYIATASQDRTVRIWTSSPQSNGEWQSYVLKFDAVAWRCSWSPSGNVLACSTADNRVSLWKEKLSGGWELVKDIEE